MLVWISKYIASKDAAQSTSMNIKLPILTNQFAATEEVGALYTAPKFVTVFFFF